MLSINYDENMCSNTFKLLIIFITTIYSLGTHADVHRCSENGIVTYQQQPCKKASPKGSLVKIYNSPVQATPKPMPDSKQASPPPVQPIVLERPVIPYPSSQKTEMELMADECLDWYRPRLRDPRGAYYREVKYEKNVLTLVIYSTNIEGGYVRKNAGCEFHDGSLNQRWTQLQAEKLMW